MVVIIIPYNFESSYVRGEKKRDTIDTIGIYLVKYKVVL